MVRPTFMLAFVATLFVAFWQPNAIGAIPIIPPIPIIPIIPGFTLPPTSGQSETLQGEEKYWDPIQGALGTAAHVAHGALAAQSSAAWHLLGILPLLSAGSRDEIKTDLDSIQESLYSKLIEGMQGQLEGATEEELQGPRMALYTNLIEKLQQQLAQTQQVKQSSESKSVSLQSQSISGLKSTLYSKVHDSLKGHLQSGLDEDSLTQLISSHDSLLTQLQSKSKEELDAARTSLHQMTSAVLQGTLQAKSEEELQLARLQLHTNLKTKFQEQLQSSGVNATEKDVGSCINAILDSGNRIIDFGRDGLNIFNIALNTVIRLGGCPAFALTPNLALDCVRNALQDNTRLFGPILQDLNNVDTLVEQDIDNILKQCTTVLGVAL